MKLWQDAQDVHEIPLHLLITFVVIAILFACAIQYGESRWWAQLEKQRTARGLR